MEASWVRPFKTNGIAARIATSIAAALALGSCANVANRPTNLPLPPDAPPATMAAVDIGGEYSFGLSFSGGGLRAAAFSHGVLEGLRGVRTPDGDLLQELAFITAVSGGALTAAHFGVFGREGLDRFRQDVLLRDFEQHLWLSFNPLGIARLLAGGMNTDAEFRDRLDGEVFGGATFSRILDRGRPDIRINATDILNRIAFPFIPRTFALICSDLRSYRVADAVAASMAVPLLFSPVVLRTYPNSCREPLPDTVGRLRDDPGASRLLRSAVSAVGGYRDTTRSHYLRLADGGLTDNYGLSTLMVSRAIIGTPHAPMTARDAVMARRVLFIIVDASEGRPVGVDLDEAALSGFDIAMHASAAAVDSSTRLAADAFQKTLKDMEAAIVAYRCSLTPEQATALGAKAGWQCTDARFTLAFVSIDGLEEPYRSRVAAIPTRLTMRAEDVDLTVEAARAAVMRLPQLREYLTGRDSMGR